MARLGPDPTRAPVPSLLPLAALLLAAPATDVPAKVLFLGNSYTDANDLPGLAVTPCP